MTMKKMNAAAVQSIMCLLCCTIIKTGHDRLSDNSWRLTEEAGHNCQHARRTHHNNLPHAQCQVLPAHGDAMSSLCNLCACVLHDGMPM